MSARVEALAKPEEGGPGTSGKMNSDEANTSPISVVKEFPTAMTAPTADSTAPQKEGIISSTIPSELLLLPDLSAPTKRPSIDVEPVTNIPQRSSGAAPKMRIPHPPPLSPRFRALSENTLSVDPTVARDARWPDEPLHAEPWAPLVCGPPSLDGDDSAHMSSPMSAGKQVGEAENPVTEAPQPAPISA